MNDHQIYVVYYRAAHELQLMRAFSNPHRAAEYAQMLRQAPFPHHDPAGYLVAPLALN